MGSTTGFLAGVVVVGLEVDGIGIDVAEHFFAKGVETHFGVTHRSRRVAVDRAEVAVAVHEGVAERPPLRHSAYSTVNRGVAMRVILTHDLTYAVGAFLVGFVTCVAHLVHAEQHTAVHGLHAVTHVGERARDTITDIE